MVHTRNNEKITLFSKSLILENGLYVINVKNENLKTYKWWQSLINPHDSFNPIKTKGFLVLRLLLYGYLNRISTYRSNKDNDLMHPYLKILLNDVEVYRTKILDNSLNIWDEKLELQIHYIKSKIEIQLYDMDETEGIVEDEYIGSAFINVCDLKLSRKYDIIIKYIDKVAILTDPYIYKTQISEESNKKKKSNTSEKSSYINNKTILKNDMNDYNIRIFAKLVNKSNCSNSILQLNTITSLNYSYIYKNNEILEKDLNVNQLYEEIKTIKLNIDTIWMPFFSIIYNIASWKTPFYSIFFVVFFCFSFIFSKFFFSFFLVALSLIFFILVSIIKESDKLKSKNFSIFDEKKKKENKCNISTYWNKSDRKLYSNVKDKKECLKKNNLEDDKTSNNSFSKDESSTDSDNSNSESSVSFLYNGNNNNMKNDNNNNNNNNNNNRSGNEEDDSDNASLNNYTDEDIDEENNLTIIKTFISSVIDDDIINNIKYIHYILFCITKSSQIFFYILRKFGYLLVILTLLLCVLNIFFYPLVARLIRFLIFSSGFILLTYNFKPTNIIYRFFICSQEYYFLKIKQKDIDIFNNSLKFI
ncbi:conserved Plasmodium protein, unknown function [Plasmodium gallinaceum]|uniref:C2 domain-containing protein n=1 Tax=Plasmodium gallinaceum TaxID=5849 RepID=A0A1J1GUE7_PLAGA|nr:conserved Plasmodium protein, unknown function [Plasmodium gallinaceum]CRG96153.1 conserved Plasmodium protein, unknown function [Plasmodium gallinaceum]